MIKTTNYSYSASINPPTVADFLAALNNENFGGHSDWRMPTVRELSTIVDNSIPSPGPTINTNYFPYTQGNNYWSSTYANVVINLVAYYWQVDFIDGLVYMGKFYGDYAVRAVCGGQSFSSFIDNGDGTVTDTVTGLMWQKATAPGAYSWEQALAYCENLILPANGYSDWRLPSRNELQTIASYEWFFYYDDEDEPYFVPEIDLSVVFPGTVEDRYWTSTTDASNSVNALTVDFRSLHSDYTGGSVQSDSKTIVGGKYVRAVRGGQCSPTVVTLSSFNAAPGNSQITVIWATESEIDTAGFNIRRSESENGEYIKANDALISAQGSPTQGAAYSFTDENVKNRKTYFYKLEDIDLNGVSTMHGPVSATPRLIDVFR